MTPTNRNSNIADALGFDFGDITLQDPDDSAHVPHSPKARDFHKPLWDQLLWLTAQSVKPGVKLSNKSGGDLSGPVRVSGYDASADLLEIAAPDNSAAGGAAVFIVPDTIANNATGIGYITANFTSSLDTTGASLNDYVWLGASGALTLTKPSNVPVIQRVGFVKSLATNGVIRGAAFQPEADLSHLDMDNATSGILASARGGTANAFFTVSGPVSSAKTYTFPNASCTILTTNAAVTEAQGGTNQSTYAQGDQLYASAANTLSKLAIGTAGKIQKSDGTKPVWDNFFGYLSKSTSYSILSTDNNKLISFTAASLVATLPTASAGLLYTIENAYASGGLSIKTSASGQLIDGADCSTNPYILTRQYAKVTLMAIDSTNWRVVHCSGDSIENTFSAVAATSSGNPVSLTTVSLSVGEWSVSGSLLIAGGAYTSGRLVLLANSVANGTSGDNALGIDIASTGNGNSLSLSEYRFINTGAAATMNLIGNTVFSVAPSLYGRLTARRIR